MNRQNFRSFLSGVLVALLCVALVGSAAATIGQHTLTVDYNDIKVTLDGKQVDLKDVTGSPVEPFVVNGTTYLPVRAVGEALGLSVDWDGETHTVVLASQASPQTATNAGDWMDGLSAQDRYDVTFAFLRTWIQTAQNGTVGGYPTYTEERTRPGGSGEDVFHLSYIEDRDEIALTMTAFDGGTFSTSYIAFSSDGSSGLVSSHFVANYSSSSENPSGDGYSYIYTPTFGPDSNYSFYLYSGNKELQSDYEKLSKWMCLSSLDFLNYIFEAHVSQYGAYSLSDLGFDLDALGL